MSDTPPPKVLALDSAARLLKPTRYDPQMRRPVTTVAGSALVMLRVVSGVVWLIDVVRHWHRYVGEIRISGLPVTPEAVQTSLRLFVAVAAVVLVVEAVFAVLVFLGRNLPRVIVMTIAAISITAAFVAWTSLGQEITLRTTLLSLGLDILVLLALSSRSAAAYARRNERPPS